MIRLGDDPYLRAFEAACLHINKWCGEKKVEIEQVYYVEQDIFIKYKCPECGKVKKKKWKYFDGPNMYVWSDNVCWGIQPMV